MVDMQLIFLGTSSGVPTVQRGLSSIALIRGAELLLFDAGEGMQRNFIKAGLGMNKKMKIFITHMHADHCVGLLGLLQTMELVTAYEQALKTSLPADIRSLVERQFVKIKEAHDQLRSLEQVHSRHR